MVILDTNIIIDHLRRSGTDKSFYIQIQEKSVVGQLAISIITVQELFTGLSTKNERNEDIILSLLSGLKILPYTFEVAQEAGKIVRDSVNPVDFADAAIAATAVISDGKLFTLNRKHFEAIPNLELAEL